MNTILLSVVGLLLATFGFVSAETADTADHVIISLALNWDDLWKHDASYEEVSEKEREETVNEVLIEIGNKMKRRN